MKIGYIDIGGGLRDAYGAGVLEYCLDNDIHFDYCIGVSAGAANIAHFIAGQKGTMYPFYNEYVFRKEYISVQNLITKGAMLDLDYVYGTLSNSTGENPLNYERFQASPTDFYVVTTDAHKGLPVYFNKKDIKKDEYSAFKASAALPMACHPYKVNGTLYFDGGLSDPIPLHKAFEDGCDKVILLLTKPVTTKRTLKDEESNLRFLIKKYPATAAILRKKPHRYNTLVKEALKLQEEGKVLIVAPDDTLGVTTLTRDKTKIDALYRKGYADGVIIKEFMEKIRER